MDFLKIRDELTLKQRIVIAASLVTLSTLTIWGLCSKPSEQIISSKFMNFYPSNTTFYVELTPSEISKYNFGAQAWWQILLNNMFVEKNTKISYGGWETTNNKKVKMLAVPVKSKTLTIKGLELFLGEKARLFTYKGFTIYRFDKKRIFLFFKDKNAFISESFSGMKEVINNLKSPLYKGFPSTGIVKKALNHIESKNDFFILRDYYRIVREFNDSSGNKFSGLVDFYNKNPEFMEFTVSSIEDSDGIIKVNSHITYNEDRIKDSTLRNRIKPLLKPNKRGFDLGFLPENTVCLISAYDFGSWLKIFLDVNQSSTEEKTNYEQLIKEITGLDYDKDIAPVLNKQLTIAYLPYLPNKAGAIGILPYSKESDKVISSLMSVISTQMPDAKASTVDYKGVEFNLIEFNKNFTPIVYGKIKTQANQDMYILGEKSAVEEFMDSSKFKQFKSPVNLNTEAFIYYNGTESKKYKQLNFITEKLPKAVEEVEFASNQNEHELETALIFNKK